MIELGGSEPATGYDQLVVHGQANLGGTLAICLIDGFIPEIGDTFEIVAADSISETFSQTDLANSAARRGFDVRYEPNSVILTTTKTEFSSFAQWRANVFTTAE